MLPFELDGKALTARTSPRRQWEGVRKKQLEGIGRSYRGSRREIILCAHSTIRTTSGRPRLLRVPAAKSYSVSGLGETRAAPARAG